MHKQAEDINTSWRSLVGAYPIRGMNMRQRISVEKLSELSNEQRESLREWWWGSNPTLHDVYALKFRYDDVTRYEGSYSLAMGRDFSVDYHKGEAIPLLSIGQMIELLNENSTLINFLRYDDCNGERWNVKGTLHRKLDRVYSHESLKEELCDALWEAVKQVLTLPQAPETNE